MNEHWIVRIGDGKHFIRSSKFNIWGLNSKNKTNTSKFINEVKKDDKIWFVTSKSHGKAIAVATFTELKKRQIGPLIDLTLTNEELGWTESDGEWDTEVHFDKLYNLSNIDIITKIRSPRTYRRYSDNKDKIPINLYEEYIRIVKYSNVTQSM
tara:strand:- start:56 stop:514 length:459 start_codon:yes stop_codon:yes gene_type:complete